ncbi:MAG TPA: LemA family protein [Candidatus Limnocylindrales bacterium]|nr:LemA family protein [Candidatus Limnocylindrales bacterium]
MTPAGLAAMFAVGLLAVIVVYIGFATYNAIVALRLRIDKAWANIDVALKQRFDQLPNLVEAVRGVMAWEQSVLTEVAAARAAYQPAAPIPEQAATSEATSAAIRSLFAVVENYPEVRSAANVMSLQEEIERLEGIIADRRELYNDQVYRYNARIAQFPGLVLAALFGWRARPFFEASDADRVRPATDLTASA